MSNKLKLTRTILCLTLAAVCVGLSIFFLVVPFVKVDTRLDINKPDYIEVHKNGDFVQSFAEDTAFYGEVMDLYDKGFSTTKNNVMLGNDKVTTLDVKVQSASTPTYKDGMYLVFGYNKTQVKIYGKTKVEFKRVIIKLVDSSEMTTVNAYIVNDSDSKIEYYYETSAKTADIYSKLNSIC